jgi:SAM-dependent methyltransferase
MHDSQYQGVDNLEALAHAVRYSRFLVDCIVDASDGRRTALDFGAGTGSISTLARDRGLQISCVEPDPRLRARLSTLGFDVYDDIDRVPARSQEFIFAVNVLEHIENDEGTLAVLCSKLRPGGRCFLYVPALRVLFSSMDRKIGHYRRYHRDALLRIATNAGFRIERAEYADSMGFFVTLLYRIIGSRKGDLSPASVWIYDRLVFPVSRAFDRLGCSRWFGKNLLVVMRRPAGVEDRA